MKLKMIGLCHKICKLHKGIISLQPVVLSKCFDIVVTLGIKKVEELEKLMFNYSALSESHFHDKSDVHFRLTCDTKSISAMEHGAGHLNFIAGKP